MLSEESEEGQARQADGLGAVNITKFQMSELGITATGPCMKSALSPVNASLRTLFVIPYHVCQPKEQD